MSQSPEAYERLILDAMRGDATLFTRNDEVEALWAIIDPILEAWQRRPAADGHTTRPARPARRRRTSCSAAAAAGGACEALMEERLVRAGHHARRASRRRCGAARHAQPRGARVRARARAQPGRDRRPRVAGRDRQPPRAGRALPPLAHDPLRGQRGPQRRSTRGRRSAPTTPRPAPATSRSAASGSTSTSARSTWPRSTRSSTRCSSPTSPPSCGRRTATPTASTRCGGWRRSCCWTPRTSRRSRGGFARSQRAGRARLRRRPRVAALDAVARAHRRRVRPAGRARPPARHLLGHRPPPRGLAGRRRAVLRLAGSRLGWEPGSLASASGRLHRPCAGQAPGGQDRARAGRPERARPGRGDDRDGVRRGGLARPRARAACARCGARATARSTRGPCSAPRAARRGILGEGVRQALLRDPTYRPALDAARAFVS